VPESLAATVPKTLPSRHMPMLHSENISGEIAVSRWDSTKSRCRQLASFDVAKKQSDSSPKLAAIGFYYQIVLTHRQKNTSRAYRRRLIR